MSDMLIPYLQKHGLRGRAMSERVRSDRPHRKALSFPILRVALACGLVAQCGSAAAADTNEPMAPDARVTSPGGVDMRSGQYNYSAKDLSIGSPENGGIVLERGPQSTSPQNYHDPFEPFSSNWDVHMSQHGSVTSGGVVITVSVLGLSYTFTSPLADYSVINEVTRTAYATLVSPDSGSTFLLTQADGTQVQFNGPKASSITKPNGIKYTLTYDQYGLASVVSNTGYALLLQNSGTSPNHIVHACVVNQAVDGVLTTCPVNAPQTSYSYTNNRLSSMTDAMAKSWTFSTTFTGRTAPHSDSYYKPGIASPYLTVDYAAQNWTDYVTKQTWADGHVTDYEYTGETYSCGGVNPPDCNDKDFPLGYAFTDNGNARTQLEFYVGPVSPSTAVSPGPTSVTDPAGRKTLYDYCGTGFCSGSEALLGFTLPSGLKTDFTRDSYRNITDETRTSSLDGTTMISRHWQFANCAGSTTLIACSSPTKYTDANGNVYLTTYSTNHGMKLTETLPAVGGIAPVRRYAYAQKSALIKNTSGGYTAAAPVWVLTSMKTCRTSATTGSTCSTAGDEITTTYDYGPTSGAPNNLLLRGVAVSDGTTTRRTCYGYDGQGNKISETSPRAGLTSCP